jgi:hypothetical protein
VFVGSVAVILEWPDRCGSGTTMFQGRTNKDRCRTNKDLDRTDERK